MFAAQIAPLTPATTAIDLPNGENDMEVTCCGPLTVAETNGNKCLAMVSVCGSLLVSTNSLSPIRDKPVFTKPYSGPNNPRRST